MLDAHSFTEKILSRVRRACKNIDEKAQKVAGLAEVNGLLVEVDITIHSFEALHDYTILQYLRNVSMELYRV